jgi:hypothetical protein
MLDAQSSNLRADTDILECGYRPSYANSLSDTYPHDVLLAAPSAICSRNYIAWKKGNTDQLSWGNYENRAPRSQDRHSMERIKEVGLHQSRIGS